MSTAQHVAFGEQAIAATLAGYTGSRPGGTTTSAARDSGRPKV